MFDTRGNHLLAGARYFVEGVRLLMHRELRKYLLVPLGINCLFFVVLTSLFIGYFDDFLEWGVALPSWLEFLEKALKVLAWIVVPLLLLIAYGYSFNLITTIFGAPFYGLLAQKAEELITGVKPPDEPLVRMVPRTIFRELQKVLYFIGRGILILLLTLLLSTLFILAIFAPVVGLLWSAWCMVIQFADYAADNHQTPFRRLRKKLRVPLYSSIGFGGAVMIVMMIPVVNIVAAPAAVIGGTIFWVREVRGSREVGKSDI